MNLTLELSDEETLRLEALAEVNGRDVAQAAHDVPTAHLPQVQISSQTTLSDVVRRWNSEDAAAADSQSSIGLADWERLEGDLGETRLELRVPEIS